MIPLASWAAPLGLAVLACPQLPLRVPDSYTVRGEEVKVWIYLDAVGVVRHDGQVERDHPTEVDDTPDGFALLDLVPTPGPTVRDGLTTLVEDLANDPAHLHAGLLVNHEGSERPLLLTQEVIVRFRPGTGPAAIREVVERHELVERRRSEFVEELYVFDVRGSGGLASQLDAIEVVKLLNEEPVVDYAEPNAVVEVDRTAAPQWHLENRGEGGGTRDADIDAHRAWEMTRGSHDTIVAVLEDGFDWRHPALLPNCWFESETSTEPGRSFFACSVPGCVAALDVSTDRLGTAHGTAVAGCATAVFDPETGIGGSCPGCALMPIRRSLEHFQDGEALRYAADRGAAVISNSWRYPGSKVPVTVADAIQDAVHEGRDGLGCVVLFAVMNSETNLDNQSFAHEICHEDGVLVVGSIANTDQRVMRCGYGSPISVLGPSRFPRPKFDPVGTLAVATVDWRGEGNGYNADPELASDAHDGGTPCEELDERFDYTRCFGGSSAATPIVAGVCGLVLDADPTLTGAEVRRLVQDTCDRADPLTGIYDPVNGYSTTKYTGNGRVNAYEAVHVVAPTDVGGLGGVDLLIRDNHLDWGNTDVPSFVVFDVQRGTLPYWTSPDVKVDGPAGPRLDPADFDAFESEDVVGGEECTVWVRVRNRGPRASDAGHVALYWTSGGGALPSLPKDFWESGLAAPLTGAGGWSPIGVLALDGVSYSGPSVAGTDEDAARILVFDWTPPVVAEDEATFLSLLAVADAPRDPARPDSLAPLDADHVVPRDNNAALRTALLLSAAPDADDVSLRVTATNRSDAVASTRLELIAPAGASLTLESVSTAPATFSVSVDDSTITVKTAAFDLEPGERLDARVSGTSPPGRIEVRQWRVEGDGEALVGGCTGRVGAPPPPPQDP